MGYNGYNQKYLIVTIICLKLLLNKSKGLQSHKKGAAAPAPQHWFYGPVCRAPLHGTDIIW